MPAMIQPLPWDSAFFKLKIGKINAGKHVPDVSSAAVEDFDLIYIEQSGRNNLNGLKKNKLLNITFTDKKTIYLKKIKKTASNHPDKHIIIYPLKTATEKIKDLSIQSGHFSRFRLDKNFKENSYRKLYIQWIKNSVEKKSADILLIYGSTAQPKGFITLVFKDKLAQIGLVAVDKTQHKKGIGRALMYAAECFALKNNFTTLQVITQTENENACLFYENLGFKKDSIIYTHHHWKKPC